MSSGIRLSGIPKFDESILELKVKVDEASRRIVERGGLMIAFDAKRLFLPRPSGSQRTSKKGKIYYSYKPPYQAQPPHPTNRSGALSRSIKVQRTEKVLGGWMSTTGPSMPYAAYVEYGTSKMKAEPYIDKSLLDAYGKLTELARIEWEKALS
jgi:HK97 gp10 family phage protein